MSRAGAGRKRGVPPPSAVTRARARTGAAVPRQSPGAAEADKRDLVILVADSGMEAMIGTFLSRKDWPQKLGCAPFGFDPKRDFVRAGGHDPGLVRREAGQILNRMRGEYRRAVVVVDHAFNDASVPPEEIHRRISAQLAGHWDVFEVVVIVPELENWFWVDYADLLKKALVWTKKGGDRTPREVLEAAGRWAPGQDKPADPKAAVEWLHRQGYARDASAGAFVRMARDVPSVRRCTDASFQHFRETLARWFPSDDQPYGHRPAESGQVTLPGRVPPTAPAPGPHSRPVPPPAHAQQTEYGQ